MANLLVIFLGGGIGAVLRHLFNNGVTHYWRHDFPLGIMLINIIGACLMGVLAGLFTRVTLSQDLRLFLTVGILGGFTTFSAFSLDTVLLLERGAYAQAALYIIGSVSLSLIGLWAGLEIIQTIR